MCVADLHATACGHCVWQWHCIMYDIVIVLPFKSADSYVPYMASLWLSASTMSCTDGWTHKLHGLRTSRTSLVCCILRNYSGRASWDPCAPAIWSGQQFNSLAAHNTTTRQLDKLRVMLDHEVSGGCLSGQYNDMTQCHVCATTTKPVTRNYRSQ